MRSHFLLSQGITATCAIAGALSMLPTNSPAQSLVAADYATNSTYASGWSAGQNGGYGFGPWSFNGTDATPAGLYQGMSTASALGRSWTLLTHSTTNGLANAGRAISEPGGLQPGQTLELVIQNPMGYSYWSGFDMLLTSSLDNNPGGNNTAPLRTLVFEYFITNWKLVDDSGPTVTPLDPSTTGVAGMKFDLTLTSTNTYSATLTPLSDPSSAYTQAGTLKTNLPINWVNFRLWFRTSSGLADTANNFEMSSMTISGPTLNIQKVGTDVLLSWLGALTNFALVSSTNLGAGAVWNPVSPDPVVVNGQNVVTNSIPGTTHQFYRLQFTQ